jgi:hypothetical protein
MHWPFLGPFLGAHLGLMLFHLDVHPSFYSLFPFLDALLPSHLLEDEG